MRAPILFIKKKDSLLQLCVNYHHLNVILKKNKYLISLILKILNYLAKAKVFTKINLHSVYNLI